MDNYCCENVDNVDKNMRQSLAIKSTIIWGSLLVGVAHICVAHHQMLRSSVYVAIVVVFGDDQTLVRRET